MDDQVHELTKEDKLTFELEDEYQRKPVAEKVIRLLTSDISISPMVIDGGWGAGKTRFCKKLINLFKQQHPNYRCIYVDAFKADHADEPLMTLLAAVAEELPAKKRDALIKKAVPAARFALKTGLKAGIGWVLRQDAVELGETFETDVQKAGEEAVNLAVESLIKDHVEANKSIATLRKALEKLADEKPIVLFIDELDRCRPDFGINMLENIKHVFDVKGVQFVLVTNTEQLRSSMMHVYGLDEENARRYLDKFVGFSFPLPTTFPKQAYDHILASKKHFIDLARRRPTLRESALVSDGVIDFASELVSVNNLTLREVETWIKYLEVYQIVSEGEGLATNIIFGYHLLRIFAVFIFCFDSAGRQTIRRGTFEPSVLIPRLGKTRITKLTADQYPDHLDLIACLISLETKAVDSNFSIADEEEALQWRERIKGYFEGRFGSSRARYLDAMSMVARQLELGDPGR